MTINLTVLLKSKEEFTEKVKELLENLVANSRNESGCLQYDLHQNIENPSAFIFHEVWENKEVYDSHNSQEYVKHFFAIAPDLLSEKATLIFTNKLA
jgi:quinol monooxygenase YgiN